jgi:hypothetical protein
MPESWVRAPPDLVKAHQILNKAVDAARVAFLFGPYQQLTSLLPPAAEKTKRSRRAG